MMWTGLGCLIYFINGVVWADNVIVTHPLWCDITSRFMTGMAVGIPCAALCIQRRLYLIATVRSVTTTKAEKRRAIYVDLAIGVGIPVLEMILQVVVQGHRFDVYETFGCFPTTYGTPVAYALVLTWPTIIGMISACYCTLTIIALAKRRSEYNTMLSNGGVNSSRYLRLMALAAIDVLCTTPLSAYLSIYLNAVSGIPAWKGWADTHYQFNTWGQYPTFVWASNYDFALSIELSKWSPFMCAIVFFAFFGFAQEARKNYRLAFDSVARKVGYTTSGGMSSGGVSSSFGDKNTFTSGGRATLPIFVRQQTTTKRDRDSCVSFSTNLSLGDVGGTLDDVKTPGGFSPTSTGSGDDCSFDDKALDIAEPPRALARDAPPHYDQDGSARPESQTLNIV
ncbi:hypothetical protein HWV62_13763 [Athelia sp. TMB]|nr:hypothetical protein HWV62_12000 [Athelia sp. TMB]KAF7984559.1 hypothetical protein HWV62_13763 [Athelia sp. TMB]